MAADFVSEVEGILGEHEADLEMNQPKSPRPGEFKPQFPAKALLYAINRGVQVGPQLLHCTIVKSLLPGTA